MMSSDGRHQGEPIFTAGVPLGSAGAVMLALHGRGASARDILTLAGELGRSDYAYMAPQAAGYTWYPRSFLAPIEGNEPALSSALARVGEVLDEIEAAGIGVDRVILLGFSQGACLATEYAARNPRRYGGVVGLSGGLIGPTVDTSRYEGSLAGTPVFLGCSDVDPHIPKERVEETGRVLQAIGGQVTQRLYPGMGHTVNQDELDFVGELMDRVAAG
jgi:predicted esterase